MRRGICWLVLVLGTSLVWADDAPVKLDSRRELFVDHHLIDKLTAAAALVLHEPRDEGAVLAFDKPWEGPFCGYVTMLKDGDRFRCYYRGMPGTGDGTNVECTCVAESRDGIHWTRPELNLYEMQGSKINNVVLANAAPLSHNFCPMLDDRPGVPPDQRYKALSGIGKTGLFAFASADGLTWKKMQPEPVFKDGAFDSQNVPLWSESEQRYVLYFRVFHDKIRRIARTTSTDFLNWDAPQLMAYRTPGVEAPIEHLYTNQTHPYFRAPHISVAIAARFMPKRQVLTTEQAKELNVNPGYFKDTSDAIFMTTRGGSVYDRTFLESFIRPGLGLKNWVSRTNYPALNVIPTGPAEMSVYVNQDYAQPTAHLHRYSLRLDGFASLWAGYAGGECLTKPLTFTGRRLSLNFQTSAAGGIRVEIQNAQGEPLPGFSLADSSETIGNEVDRTVMWKAGDDLSALAGQSVRLRFVLKDADLYSFVFE